MTQPVGATLAAVAWLIGNGLVMWSISSPVASWFTDNYWKSRLNIPLNFIGLVFIVAWFALEIAYGNFPEALSSDMAPIVVIGAILLAIVLYVGVVLVFAGVRILLYRRLGKGYRPFGHI